MKKLLFSIYIMGLSIGLQAQKEVKLVINHKLDGKTFAFNQTSENSMQHKFKISRVEYYLSKFTIIHDGGTETVVPDGKYILAQGLSKVDESLGSFNVTNVEGIKFHIGVDSPTNNADPSLQTTGPLAPKSPSMHWGWSAGYRFIALEGKAGSMLNTTFEMHGLFNENYFEQTVMATGVDNGSSISINLDADYKEALRSIDLNSGPIDHGVNRTDLDVMRNFRDHVFKASSTSLSSEKDVLSFSVPNMIGTATIGSSTITAVVSESTDITNLSPTFTIPENATISPSPSVAQDFSSPVDYTITAEDNSTKTYKVSVSKEQSSSIYSNKGNQLMISPNPSNGVFRIESKNIGIAESSISVYNSVGSLVKELNPTKESVINLSKQAKGIYYIRFTSKVNSFNQKLILE